MKFIAKHRGGIFGALATLFFVLAASLPNGMEDGRIDLWTGFIFMLLCIAMMALCMGIAGVIE